VPHDKAEAKALQILDARVKGAPSFDIPSGISLLAAFRSLDPAGAGVVERAKLRNMLTERAAMSEERADAFIASSLRRMPEVDGEPARVGYDEYVSLAMRES
jgi:hypothetical protein